MVFPAIPAMARGQSPRRRLMAMSAGSDLPEELRPIRPPAPKVLQTKESRGAAAGGDTMRIHG